MKLAPAPLSIVALIFLAAPGIAGPCQPMIDATQAAIDKAIDAIAATGPTAPESPGALLSHEPSPDSIAQEESALGEGRGPDKALAALGRARQADAAGDLAGCEKEIAKARRALGLPK